MREKRDVPRSTTILGETDDRHLVPLLPRNVLFPTYSSVSAMTHDPTTSQPHHKPHTSTPHKIRCPTYPDHNIILPPPLLPSSLLFPAESMVVVAGSNLAIVRVYGAVSLVWLWSTFHLLSSVNHLFTTYNDDGVLDGRQLMARVIPEKIETKASGMIDLDFVDLSGGFKKHPHMSALGENGEPGYVHDVKSLRRNPPRLEFQKNDTACEHNDATMQLLKKKVDVDFDANQYTDRLTKEGVKPRTKIFCHVYTTAKNHDRIQAIRETWGQRCDGFLAASTVTDKSVDAVNIPHIGKEAYNNMWQKVRAMWSYVYDHYYDDYDWFMIGGDDMYVLVENLRLYLESEEIVNASNGGEKPLLLGQQFYQHGNRSDAYVTGGGGYTLNKAALKTLVTSFPNCAPHEVTSGEDYMVTQCLSKQGIEAYWTTDETGADRYNHVHPEFEFNFDPKKNPLFWYTYFSANENVGPARVAKRSVSFHLKSGDVVGKPKVENQMRRVHAILYGHCANVTLGPPVPTQRWSDGKILWRYWKSPIKECELKAKADEICICSENTVQTCNVRKQKIVTNNTSHQVLTNENIERKLDDNEGGSDYVRLSKSITTLKQSHAALSQKLEQAEATLNTILGNQEQMKSRIETILHHVVPNAPSPLPTKKRKASISSATAVKARTRPVVDEHEDFIAK